MNRAAWLRARMACFSSLQKAPILDDFRTLRVIVKGCRICPKSGCEELGQLRSSMLRGENPEKEEQTAQIAVGPARLAAEHSCGLVPPTADCCHPESGRVGHSCECPVLPGLGDRDSGTSPGNPSSSTP